MYIIPKVQGRAPDIKGLVYNLEAKKTWDNLPNDTQTYFVNISFKKELCIKSFLVA